MFLLTRQDKKQNKKKTTDTFICPSRADKSRQINLGKIYSHTIQIWTFETDHLMKNYVKFNWN